MRILAVATLCAIGLLATLWVVPGARPFDLDIIIRDPIVLPQVRQIEPAVLRAWRGDSPERFAFRGPERMAAARTVAPRTTAPQSLALRAASAAQVADPRLRIDRVSRQAAAVTLDSADSPETSIAMDAPQTATTLPTDESAQPAEESEPKDAPASAAATSNPPANTSANSDSAREPGGHRDRPSNSGQGSKGGKNAGKNREGKGGRDARRPDR